MSGRGEKGRARADPPLSFFRLCFDSMAYRPSTRLSSRSIDPMLSRYQLRRPYVSRRSTRVLHRWGREPDGGRTPRQSQAQSSAAAPKKPFTDFPPLSPSHPFSLIRARKRFSRGLLVRDGDRYHAREPLRLWPQPEGNAQLTVPSPLPPPSGPDLQVRRTDRNRDRLARPSRLVSDPSSLISSVTQMSPLPS